jgi:hypothetical protein
MKPRRRSLLLILILFGQVILAEQSFAMGDCHSPVTTAAAPEASAPHHGHGTPVRVAQADAGHDCSCAAGAHCGLVALLLPERPAQLPAVAVHPIQPLNQAWPPAVAHRRNPDRPPS